MGLYWVCIFVTMCLYGYLGTLSNCPIFLYQDTLSGSLHGYLLGYLIWFSAKIWKYYIFSNLCMVMFRRRKMSSHIIPPCVLILQFQIDSFVEFAEVSQSGTAQSQLLKMMKIKYTFLSCHRIIFQMFIEQSSKVW